MGGSHDSNYPELLRIIWRKALYKNHALDQFFEAHLSHSTLARF